MKYIRTKDGKIYEVVENDGTWTTNQISKDIVEKALNGNKYFKDDIQIIKQADTIEELCDMFVWQEMVFDRIENNCLIDTSYEELETNIDEEMIEQGIYGAIWTDKGLIYVAKMNDKGKLELL